MSTETVVVVPHGVLVAAEELLEAWDKKYTIRTIRGQIEELRRAVEHARRTYPNKPPFVPGATKNGATA